MQRMIRIDEGLRVQSMLHLKTSVLHAGEHYHEESPCRVIKEDSGCYDEHGEPNKSVELYPLARDSKAVLHVFSYHFRKGCLLDGKAVAFKL